MKGSRANSMKLDHTEGAPVPRRASGVVWNEDNLAENEKIKAALKPVKISEPKTPFHQLLPDDDIDLEPLALDAEVTTAAPSGNSATNGPKKSARPSSARIPPPSQQEEHSGDKFSEVRKAHYSMRELLAKKHDDEDEDDEDEN